MGKTTNFMFGRYIHRVHPIPNKTHCKFVTKGGVAVGVSRDCPIFEYPYNLEWVKLRTSNLARSLHANKIPWNLGEKGAWAYPARDCWNFFSAGYPILSQECVRLRTSNFVRNKSPLKISAKVAVGVRRDSRKISGHRYMQGASRGHLCSSSAFLF